MSIVALQLGNGSYNSATPVTNTIVVAPKALTYTANAAGMTYGLAVPGLSGTVGGFVGTDNQGNATTGTLTFTTTATSSSGVGGYAINGSGLTANNGNYTFVQATANAAALTINALPVNLTGTRSYDGTTTVAAGILSVANKVGGDNVTVASGNGTLAGANVGSEAITSFGTLALGGTAAGNYTLSGASGSVNVTVAGTSVVAGSSENPSGYKDSLTFTASVAPPSATGTVQFLTNGVLFDTETLSGGLAMSAVTALLPRGTNLITAEYSGDSNYLTDTNSLNQIVTNHPPTANSATYYRTAGLVLEIAIVNLATNWTDVDGDTIALSGVNVSTNGVTVAFDHSYIYYSDTNNVADQFTYTITDGYGGTNTGVVTVLMAPAATNQTQNIIGVAVNGDGSVTVSFAAIPGYTYAVQAATNLAPPVAWTIIGSQQAATNGLWQFTDTNAANYPQRFYRSSYLTNQ